jgi:hypothetical protein
VQNHFVKEKRPFCKKNQYFIIAPKIVGEPDMMDLSLFGHQHHKWTAP